MKLDASIPRYEYKGYGIHDSFCGLEIYGLSEGTPIVVMTELDENPGTSVTNACEDLANQVYKQFIQPQGIMPDKVRFIEHYPTSEVKFSEVSFRFGTNPQGLDIFYKPEWKHTKDADWLDDQIRNQK